MSELVAAIEVLLKQVLDLRPGEKLLILSRKAGEKLASQFSQSASAQGATATIAGPPADSGFYAELPKSLVREAARSDVILELCSPSAYYSRRLRRIVRQGKRAFFLTDVSDDRFEALMLGVNQNELYQLGHQLVELLKRSQNIEILTGGGCALWARLGHPLTRDFLPQSILRRRFHTFFDPPTGICRAPGTLSTLGGQVSFSPLRASINGRLRVGGAFFPPLDDCPLTEPFCVTIRSGRVVEVEPTGSGRRLAEWIEANRRYGAREVMHLSFGFNPIARPCETILETERVFGSLTVGLGYGTKGRHKDLFVLSPSIWIDGHQLFLGDKIAHPEIIFDPQALRGRRGARQKARRR